MDTQDQVRRDMQWLIDNPEKTMGSSYHDAGSCWLLIDSFRARVGELEAEVERLRSTPSLTFNQLSKANDDRAKQWNKSGVSVPLIFALVEMAGEAGEACNVGKKLARTEYGLAGGEVDMQPLKDEIADVVICCDLVARKAGFDLGQAVAEKFNATSTKRGFDVFLPRAANDAAGGGA